MIVFVETTLLGSTNFNLKLVSSIVIGEDVGLYSSTNSFEAPPTPTAISLITT